MTGPELAQFVSRFEAQKIPPAEWTHTAHLRIGAWQVFHYGADEALRRLRAGIRKLNESHGTPNSRERGYHETITVAYVRLIADFLAGFPETTPIEQRITHLLANPLGDRDALLRFYSRELLQSPQARMAWTEPDLAPLVGALCT